MIITDDFVVLNNPKTGSSFVRAVLREIHRSRLRRRSLITRVGHKFGFGRPPSFQELFLPNIKTRLPHPKDQHGTYTQIPAEHRHKAIVSVVRNPYDRLLSTYQFGWWARYPPAPENVIRNEFPHFPRLTLDEYVRLLKMARHRYHLPHLHLKVEVGGQTLGFIQMFFKDPEAVLRRLDQEYMESERFVEDMAPIQFLQTENLNTGLSTLLQRYGYSEEEVAFVRAHERVNVTSASNGEEFPVLTEQALRFVHEQERFLLRILAHLGFHYSPPASASSGSPALESYLPR